MKCSSCGGTMVYDVAKKGLVCDHCGAVQPLPKPEESSGAGTADFNPAVKEDVSDWGSARNLVTCDCCGAQLFIDSDQMSGLCPFCGSAVVITLQDAKCGLAPSAIIPFSITREQVTEKFYRWNKFAFWSPESFRKGKILGNLTPVYVPYWTFDADTVTTYSGRFGYTTGSGEDEKINWYQRTGTVEKHIEGACVCGSKKFRNDKLLNSVISFSTKDLVAYTPDALSGMAAEKYTVGIDEAWEVAKNTELNSRVTDAARAKENADRYSDLKISTEYSNIKYRYVLVPVWLTGCKYGGKVYNVVASGHNWKGNCSRPFSVAKLITFLSIFFVLFVVTSIFGLGGVFLGLGVMAMLVAFIIYSAVFMSTLSEQRQQERKMSEGQTE